MVIFSINGINTYTIIQEHISTNIQSCVLKNLWQVFTEPQWPGENTDGCDWRGSSSSLYFGFILSFPFLFADWRSKNCPNTICWYLGTYTYPVRTLTASQYRCLNTNTVSSSKSWTWFYSQRINYRRIVIHKTYNITVGKMLLQSSENATKNYDSHIMFVFMNVFEKENKKGAKIILKNYECRV